jgi:hypothetical protein
MTRKMPRWRVSPERIALALLAFSIFGTIAGSNEPTPLMFRGTSIQWILEALHSGNSILFSLSSGVLGGLLVWLLVSWIPDVRKRRIIRTNLLSRYMHFKRDVIHILLFASVGSASSDLVERLTDYEQFQNYFKANNDEQWYAALNGMQDKPDHIKDILAELELLAMEVSYVVSAVDIPEQRVHDFFKRLSENIYRLKHTSVFSYDQVKYLGRFLWGILARWDFIVGQQEDDIIETMIRRI